MKSSKPSRLRKAITRMSHIRTVGCKQHYLCFTCYAMPYHTVMQCQTTLCCAVLYHVVPCCAVLCRAMLCHAALGWAVLAKMALCHDAYLPILRCATLLCCLQMRLQTVESLQVGVQLGIIWMNSCRLCARNTGAIHSQATKYSHMRCLCTMRRLCKTRM